MRKESISNTHTLSWVRVSDEKWSAKQWKDMCWNLNYVVSGASSADRMKPSASCLESVNGSSTQLQLQRNLSEKMCGVNANEHWQRGEQAQCIPFCSVWFFPSQVGRERWVWVSFLSRAYYVNFLANSLSKQLCPLQLLFHAMLPKEIAKKLMHSQPTR